MLHKWRKKKSSPIGVDIGSRYVKLAQMQRSPDGGETLRVVHEPVPDDLHESSRYTPSVLVPLLRKMIETVGFEGSRAVACIPERMIRYQNLRLMSASDDELDAVVSEKATEQLDLDPKDHKIEYFDAGEVWESDESRREIIAMVASISAIEDLLSTLARSGLRTMAIDAAPAATARLATQHDFGNVNPGPRVVLDVGYLTTTMVVAQDEEIHLARTLEMGTSGVTELVAERLNISPTDADTIVAVVNGSQNVEYTQLNMIELPYSRVFEIVDEAQRIFAKRLAREIAKSIRYYAISFRDDQPAYGLLLGGTACQRGLDAILLDETGVVFQIPERLSGLSITSSQHYSSVNASASMYALAAGLSTYDAGDMAA